MKKTVTACMIVLVLALCLPGQASAAVYETGWGKALDSDTVEARDYLKRTAEHLVDPQDSVYEKVKKLNQYVCDKAEYDSVHNRGGLVNFVRYSRVICTGYGQALAYLLDCANIRNFTVTGYVTSGEAGKTLHIWNVVFLDGIWLHVDPTWNDATRSPQYPDGRYFLLPGEKIGADRQISLKTPEDYEAYYASMRTIRVSFQPGDSYLKINGAKQSSAASADTNGADRTFSLQNGRTFAPLHDLAYALGCYVSEEDGKICLILGTKTLEMTTGAAEAYLDGKPLRFAAVSEIVNDQIMIPVRTVFEALGAAVDYDAATSEVSIFFDPYIS